MLSIGPCPHADSSGTVAGKIVVFLVCRDEVLRREFAFGGIQKSSDPRRQAGSKLLRLHLLGRRDGFTRSAELFGECLLSALRAPREIVITWRRFDPAARWAANLASSCPWSFHNLSMLSSPPAMIVLPSALAAAEYIYSAVPLKSRWLPPLPALIKRTFESPPQRRAYRRRR